MSIKNLCVYCKSSAYGPGCPFSPTGVHFHASDPKKCCFCGSSASGPGCPFNPHGKMHIHGVEFNSMVNETIEKSITLGYLMNELSTPIVEMKAYELGLIDERGKRLREPKTPQELSCYGPLEEYIIGLKQTLGPRLGLINNAIDVQLESAVGIDEYKKICCCTSNIKSKFEQIGVELKQEVARAYDEGLSTAVIEKLIIESIFENEK